jgi:hypothetical protein
MFGKKIFILKNSFNSRTIRYECCEGYTRGTNQFGCPEGMSDLEVIIITVRKFVE